MEPKFQIGDTVQCLNPTHPGENPFVVDWICLAEPITYYPDDDRFPQPEHIDSGLIGCRESELELVKKGGE